MTEEINLVEEIKKDKKFHVKNKWISYTFGPEPMKLEPYEIDPVTDIPIRLAVEKGVIPRKRDLALYRIAEDWNGHPQNSILIAGPIAEGQPFAIWVGDGSYIPAGNDAETAAPEQSAKPVEMKEMPVFQSGLQPGFEQEIVRLAPRLGKLFTAAKKQKAAARKQSTYNLFKKPQSTAGGKKTGLKPKKRFFL